jgi:hypothetical protein
MPRPYCRLWFAVGSNYHFLILNSKFLIDFNPRPLRSSPYLSALLQAGGQNRMTVGSAHLYSLACGIVFITSRTILNPNLSPCCASR